MLYPASTVFAGDILLEWSFHSQYSYEICANTYNNSREGSKGNGQVGFFIDSPVTFKYECNGFYMHPLRSEFSEPYFLNQSELSKDPSFVRTLISKQESTNVYRVTRYQIDEFQGIRNTTPLGKSFIEKISKTQTEDSKNEYMFDKYSQGTCLNKAMDFYKDFKQRVSTNSETKALVQEMEKATGHPVNMVIRTREKFDRSGMSRSSFRKVIDLVLESGNVKWETSIVEGRSSSTCDKIEFSSDQLNQELRNRIAGLNASYVLGLLTKQANAEKLKNEQEQMAKKLATESVPSDRVNPNKVITIQKSM